MYRYILKNFINKLLKYAKNVIYYNYFNFKPNKCIKHTYRYVHYRLLLLQKKFDRHYYEYYQYIIL